MPYNNFDDWLNAFQKQNLPYWEELPAIELYMDQVINVINGYIEPIIHMSITKSMINSYVKFKIVERPVNKKYATNHLAEIIVTSLMKQVFSLDIIKLGIAKSLEQSDTIDAYNAFVKIVNEEIATINSAQNESLIDFSKASLPIVQRMAVKSFLYKTMSINLIQYNETDTGEK